MANSIKIELYELLKTTLTDLKLLNQNVFKYIGHYNSQDLENDNNFAFDTPAAFISLSQIDWMHTKHDAPAVDATREQDGITQIAIHYFLHDLRTDSDSYIDHLEIIDLAYRALIGLRSGESINGKISSLKRIKELDEVNNNNLWHWVTIYQTRLQEAGGTAGKVDAQPITFEIISEPVEEITFAAINDFDNLLYNDNDKIKIDG